MVPQRALSPERYAEQLLRKLGLERPPVDVEKIVADLGARVEKVDLGDDCSGVLVRCGDAAMIGIHWDHHPNRQRFTIAHEVGHYLLHDGGTYVDRSTTARFRSHEAGSGTAREEREANQFAAALLMPSRWVRQEFSRQTLDLGDDLALNELCELFQVSAQAMMWRLKNLDLLEFNS